MVEVEKDNTRGIATGGLTTGIIGTALGAMNSGLIPGLFGGGCYNNGNSCGSQMVNRYEAAQSARIAELETEVKLRDANTYTLTEMGKLRDYVDRRLDCVNAQLNQQAVINAQVAANLSCLQGTVSTLSGMTKTVIPIANICPEPMARYNSWAAPTTDTTAGA
jgi:hypothetical protein